MKKQSQASRIEEIKERISELELDPSLDSWNIDQNDEEYTELYALEMELEYNQGRLKDHEDCRIEQLVDDNLYERALDKADAYRKNLRDNQDY